MHFQYQDYEHGTIEAQKAFFNYCEQKLRKLVGYYQGPIETYRRHYFYPFNHQPQDIPNYDREFLNHTLSDLYFEGFEMYRVLNCSFADFKQGLCFGNHLHSHYRHYYGRPALPQSGYVKKPHHKPKVIDEKTQSKIDWRESKGFTKDHSRRNRSMYGGSKRYAKHFSNRFHRQWERECIQKERFDELGDFTNKSIFDPWMWD